MVKNFTNLPGQYRSNKCDLLQVLYGYFPVPGTFIYSNVFVVIVNILLSAVGTIVNVLVIAAYGKNENLRTSTNLLFLPLAVTDLISASVAHPMFVILKVKEMYGPYPCLLATLVCNLSAVCCGISLQTVALISVERFITLAYPYRYEDILTARRLKFAVIGTWLAAFAPVLVDTFGLFIFKTALIIEATLIFVSVVLVVLIWIWIHRLVRRHTKMIKAVQVREPIHRKKMLRSTRTSYVIAGSVLVCYFPEFVVFLCVSFILGDFSAFRQIGPWAHTVLYANSILNPLLLLWRKREVRDTVRNLVLKREN